MSLTTVKNFNYSQTSASPMAGTAGYLNNILYACLVTGYNTKTVSSIVVSSNIVTVTTSTDHGYSDGDIINISGANESIFNDDFYITTISTTSFRFPLVTFDSSATGTISCKIAPLGWERVFTGTNKAVYRPPAGNRFYLRIDDTNATYAIVSSYETMTTVNAGTNKMGDVYWVKSNASGTTAKEWYLFGNDRLFHFFTAWHASYSSYHINYHFGDITSVKQNDNYATILMGHTVSAPTNQGASQYCNYVTFNTGYYSGQYLMRSGTGIVGAVNFFKYVPGGNIFGISSFPFPNTLTNCINLYSIDVAESTLVQLRGQIPGLYAPLENVAGFFNSNDKTVIINSKVYCAIKIFYSTAAAGNVFVDITGPW